MADHINKLQLRLQEAEQQVYEYESLLLEARDRLQAMQKDCDRKQKQTLAAFVGWMMGQFHRYQN